MQQTASRDPPHRRLFHEPLYLTLNPKHNHQISGLKNACTIQAGGIGIQNLAPSSSSPPDPWSLSLGKATLYREGAAPWQLQAGYSRECWDGRNIFQLKSTHFSLHLSLGNIHDENLDSMTVYELWKPGWCYSGWCCLWLTLRAKSDSQKDRANTTSAKDPVPSIF